MRIEFEVVGEPKPQGSKKSTPIYRKDGELVRTADGRIMTRTIDDNPKTGQWKQEIAQAARQTYRGSLLDGPLALWLTFVRPRPKSHYGTGRNAARLKDSAPAYPTGRPDTLKLARAVEDALTGVVWRDDSLICRHHLGKVWGDYFCVHVAIEAIEHCHA
jgi:crossover junction endodeoxyribonuclease RusA